MKGSRNKKSFFGKLSGLFSKKTEGDDLSQKFTAVYNKNLFKGKESISGPGSDLTQTKVIIEKLPDLLAKHNVRSMIDAPCGDFFWMRHVDLSRVHYTGIDIVKELIEKDNQEFKTADREFISLDIVNGDLPKADLIFCRDCLVHLSDENVRKAIANFKRSGTNYLLTTTFPGQKENKDLGKIIWRPLNLTLAPFKFPQPIEMILEECTEDDGKYKDKSLGLWKLNDIDL